MSLQFSQTAHVWFRMNSTIPPKPTTVTTANPDVFRCLQMKLSSLKLAKDYMKRITKELQNTESSCDENLVLQGVRFAYRVHQVKWLQTMNSILTFTIHLTYHQEIQFAGGFDAETIQAFEKLKRVGLGSDK